MLARLEPSDRTVAHVRHQGAMADLVCCTDLLVIVPQMFAESPTRRLGLQSWNLPGRGTPHDVRMMGHRSAANDAAHVWPRDRARGLITSPSRAVAAGSS